MLEFPKFFHNFYSHMIMIEVETDLISLMPLNQCDWFFNLKKINDTKWTVSGQKDDIFSVYGTEKQSSVYELINNEWKCTSEE